MLADDIEVPSMAANKICDYLLSFDFHHHYFASSNTKNSNNISVEIKELKIKLFTSKIVFGMCNKCLITCSLLLNKKGRKRKLFFLVFICSVN